MNKEKLLWGSIAPDITPYYKFIRHYKNESINYISREIANLIFLCQGKDFEKGEDLMLNKYLSKKLGIISHYLCDYTCYPHAERITCVNSKRAREHLSYEMRLNEFSKNHQFHYLSLETEDLTFDSFRVVTVTNQVKNYINQVVEEYMTLDHSYEKDLNFALTLNIKITNFIFEAIRENVAEYTLQRV